MFCYVYTNGKDHTYREKVKCRFDIFRGYQLNEPHHTYQTNTLNHEIFYLNGFGRTRISGNSGPTNGSGE